MFDHAKCEEQGGLADKTRRGESKRRKLFLDVLRYFRKAITIFFHVNHYHWCLHVCGAYQEYIIKKLYNNDKNERRD